MALGIGGSSSGDASFDTYYPDSFYIGALAPYQSGFNAFNVNGSEGIGSCLAGKTTKKITIKVLANNITGTGNLQIYIGSSVAMTITKNTAVGAQHVDTVAYTLTSSLSFRMQNSSGIASTPAVISILVET